MRDIKLRYNQNSAIGRCEIRKIRNNFAGMESAKHENVTRCGGVENAGNSAMEGRKQFTFLVV